MSGPFKNLISSSFTYILINFLISPFSSHNLSLIPGNVGAAPIQNIGAYGVELKDVFDSCRVLSRESNEIEHFNKDKCEFNYRSSIFKSKEKNKYVILSIRLKLSKEPHSFNLTYDSLKERFNSKEINLSNLLTLPPS